MGKNHKEWIICAGMLRSGSTLQFNIAAEIVERAEVGRRERHIENHECYFSHAELEETIVLKSHLLTPEIRGLLTKDEVKVLLTYRDVRDVVASWQAKTRTQLNNEDAILFADMAVSQFNSWDEIDPSIVYRSRYEDFIENLDQEIKNIADFFKIQLTQELVDDIANSVSVETMKNIMKSSTKEHLTTSGAFTWNSRTLVHIDHLNGGTVGRYKTDLPLDLQMILADRYSDWLSSLGYEVE